MSDSMLRARPLRMKVRRVTIFGSSGLEARRLADAFAPALERAFVAAREGSEGSRASRLPADEVSHAVREVVVRRLERSA